MSVISERVGGPCYRQGPVLVTGGSGFIGTHLVAALLDAGAKVINLDINPPVLAEQASCWVKCDLADLAAVHSLVAREQPALIYNLAAHARLDGTYEDMRINVEGVKNIFAAVETLPNMPLVIQASTMVVAGAGTGNFDPKIFEPQFGLYAQSKVEAEKFMHALPARYRWSIVRPSVIWGPYHSSLPNQAWRFIRQRVYLHPAGFDVVRSYGYVENIVHQIMRLAELDAALVEGQTYYVGDAPLPSAQWLDAFGMALTGKPVRRVPKWLLRAVAYAGEFSKTLGGPSPINLGRLARMTTDFPIPMEPTFALMGPPRYSLQEGVERTVRWLKSKG